MVIDIKMCRFDNVPWGFRLVGGSDFEIPLTVVKVTEGSLAEEAGLRVDDVIVRINDDAASPMSHDEAHKVISHCGNVFYLGIQREGEEEEKENYFPITSSIEPKRSLSRTRSPDSLVDSSIHSQVDNISCEDPHRASKQGEPIIIEEPDNEIADEEIATLLADEADESLEENVLGVNVNRVFPKPVVCQSSEVLRQLNDEAIKTKLEKEKDKKKWTTFMQKPDRPIPKSKQQIAAEARAANAYKVQIIKNYKKPEPVRPPTPVPEPVVEPEELPKEKTPPPEIEEEPPTDSEVPNLEPTEDAAVVNEMESEKNEDDAPKEEVTEPQKEDSVEKDVRAVESMDRDDKTPSESGSVREKTEEELQLEEQLASVQRQLLALSNLPSTIQSTLDAVTKQLSELLPTFKLQTNIVKEAKQDVKAEEKKEERIEITTSANEETIVAESEVTVNVEKTLETMETQIEHSECYETVHVEMESKQIVEEKIQALEVTERNINIEEEQMEEEQNLKRKKEHGVIEELQKQIEQKETQKRKRSKRMFGPLVPQERPLVLPGGRRWYRPKDAYNDEFIAETLTAQAELIAGTAVGYKFESSLLGYDERENNCASVASQLEKRVNFMKYQKPEKKVDLDKSEVYKVIHHLDKSPIRGIEVRPPVVVAEADVLKIIES